MYDLCAADDVVEIRRRHQASPYSAELLHHGLLTAASSGHADLCVYLLGCGAKLSRSVASSGVRSRSRAVLQVLMDHGWDINDEEPPLWPHILLCVLLLRHVFSPVGDHFFPRFSPSFDPVLCSALSVLNSGVIQD